jgi:DNA-binding response OmpR family regulator
MGVEIATAALWWLVVTAILFVEDDAASRRNIALFLRLSGYEVYEAEDGEAALRLLSSRQFEIVISDFNLPGELSGIDVLSAAKTIPHNIAALLITAQGSDAIRRRVDSLGAAYMEKPVRLQDLKRTIQQRAH